MISIHQKAPLYRDGLLKEIPYPDIGDKKRGFLSFVEAGPGKVIPFEIKRVYFIYGMPRKTQRGDHAHRTVEQVFFVLRGEISCRFDNGKGEFVSIESWKGPKAAGLYVAPMVWQTMRCLSKDTVILALASGYHDEAEYIRDRAEFERLAKAEGE